MQLDLQLPDKQMSGAYLFQDGAHWPITIRNQCSGSQVGSVWVVICFLDLFIMFSYLSKYMAIEKSAVAHLICGVIQ